MTGREPERAETRSAIRPEVVLTRFRFLIGSRRLGEVKRWAQGMEERESRPSQTRPRLVERPTMLRFQDEVEGRGVSEPAIGNEGMTSRAEE